jgi:hypothetical protein
VDTKHPENFVEENKLSTTLRKPQPQLVVLGGDKTGVSRKTTEFLKQLGAAYNGRG